MYWFPLFWIVGVRFHSCTFEILFWLEAFATVIDFCPLNCKVIWKILSELTVSVLFLSSWPFLCDFTLLSPQRNLLRSLSHSRTDRNHMRSLFACNTETHLSSAFGCASFTFRMWIFSSLLYLSFYPNSCITLRFFEE